MSLSYLTVAEFESRFKPVANPLNSNAQFNGWALESKEEMALVDQVDPARVWTIISANGNIVITSGFHFVNRDGYIITEVPVPEGRMFEVDDGDDDDNEDLEEE